ncbi:MAG: UDP-N-acetylmuramoyl-tripeptide--D-alanyl-D-alanine ligase [Bifidobacteriaceae bacterium]|jgi:UDP-N-acetylmuramoyl-tripeptide--D-alanyl-D-alanine ligase|nr:UDP-N-acetylmuramoyl-tripeptide--D-alanyl-D-alanine ligase [Bifidobacteriaceae bacterium]
MDVTAALTAGRVASATGGSLESADPGMALASVAIDSREVRPGGLFVAIRGERADGHDYARAAIEAGAALVLASRTVAVPHVLVPDTGAALIDLARAHAAALKATSRIQVAAITGSVGKTTAKDLLARICAAMGPTVAAKGSFNNRFGLPLTVLAATPDTRFLVLEMGANHVGEIAALAEVAAADVGVVLGVAPAHIGEFGSLEAIAAAKGELPAALGPSATAVLNADDPLVAGMATSARVVGFGVSPGAIVRLRSASTDDDGHLTASISTPAGAIRIPTALIGAHQATNVLSAVAAGQVLGADLATIVEALTHAGPDSPHRMALTHLPRGVRILDDSYNASPTSAAAALETLAKLASASGQRAWAVLGQMLELGADGEAAHRELGTLAGRLGLDRLVAVGEGARPAAEAALEAGMDPRAVAFFEAVPSARDLGTATAANTIILVKGSQATGLWRLADALTAPDDRQGATPC